MCTVGLLFSRLFIVVAFMARKNIQIFTKEFNIPFQSFLRKMVLMVSIQWLVSKIVLTHISDMC